MSTWSAMGQTCEENRTINTFKEMKPKAPTYNVMYQIKLKRRKSYNSHCLDTSDSPIF